MADRQRTSIHRQAPGARRRGKAGKTLKALLLLSALPVAATVVVLVLPRDKQEALLAKIPPGGGRYALAAVVAFAAMALLAWVVLPLLHLASAWLRGRWLSLTDRSRGARILLGPVQVVLEATWLAFQALFAMDAFLILLAAFLGLLFTIRIVDPGLLPGIASGLGGS